MNERIDYLFTNDKNRNGLINELLISGNLSKLGFKTEVINDRNPLYDLKIEKGSY